MKNAGRFTDFLYKLKEIFMKKNKFMVLGMSAIALALILAFADCATASDGSNASAAQIGSEPATAADLAEELNAIEMGSATINGNVVTLTRNVWVRNNLTVPESVILDLTADGVRFFLQDGATLTVNGTVNARGHSEENNFRGSLTIDPGTIVINGNGTISLSSRGRILSLWSGDDRVSLSLDGVTLVGLDNNSESLVWVGEGSEFTMKRGAITGNSRTSDWTFGGGVHVWRGAFTMEGGEISGNNASIGGGVYVGGNDEGISFTMTGGVISDNTADRYGGGVAVDGGTTFTMTGGEISGNAAREAGGGGVRVMGQGTTFTMSGGTISSNSSDSGGGIAVSHEAAFTMTGGKISGNAAREVGGGVLVGEGGTFNMKGGVISDNNADRFGGGVEFEGGGTFTMTDGVISGNTSTAGGGVRVMGQGTTFIMSGGEISGNRVQGGDKGGGVLVFRGTFTMYGGAIYGNSVQGSNMAFGGGLYLDISTFTMFGGRIQGSTASDGYAANTITASTEWGAALNVDGATATWGTGGTYTIGGVPQTGGSNIGGTTNETLIAIPAPLFPENMLGNWDKDDDSSFIGFYNLMDRNPPDARIRPFNIADWILEDISGNIYTLSATNGGWRMDLKFTATIDTDGKLIISGAEEIAFGDNTISGFSYTEYSASDLNGTYTKQP